MSWSRKGNEEEKSGEGRGRAVIGLPLVTRSLSLEPQASPNCGCRIWNSTVRSSGLTFNVICTRPKSVVSVWKRVYFHGSDRSIRLYPSSVARRSIQELRAVLLACSIVPRSHPPPPSSRGYSVSAIAGRFFRFALDVGWLYGYGQHHFVSRSSKTAALLRALLPPCPKVYSAF
jgi:hypothetical protein